MWNQVSTRYVSYPGQKTNGKPNKNNSEANWCGKKQNSVFQIKLMWLHHDFSPLNYVSCNSYVKSTPCRCQVWDSGRHGSSLRFCVVNWPGSIRDIKIFFYTFGNLGWRDWWFPIFAWILLSYSQNYGFHHVSVFSTRPPFQKKNVSKTPLRLSRGAENESIHPVLPKRCRFSLCFHTSPDAYIMGPKSFGSIGRSLVCLPTILPYKSTIHSS